MILPSLLDVSGRSRRNAYRAMRELGQHRAEVDDAARAVDVARASRGLQADPPSASGPGRPGERRL